MAAVLQEGTDLDLASLFFMNTVRIIFPGMGDISKTVVELTY